MLSVAMIAQGTKMTAKTSNAEGRSYQMGYVCQMDGVMMILYHCCKHVERCKYSSLFPLQIQTDTHSYIDAIEVLYTSNTFDFDCMESLISFSICILPHRFDSIQSLQLDLRFNHSHFFSEGTPTNDFSRWERMWRIVGSMKNLQHLWVRIIWWRTDLTGAEEARYLSELLQVGKLKTFEISLPELKWKDPKEKDLEATFEVIRRPVGK